MWWSDDSKCVVTITIADRSKDDAGEYNDKFTGAKKPSELQRHSYSVRKWKGVRNIPGDDDPVGSEQVSHNCKRHIFRGDYRAGAIVGVAAQGIEDAVSGQLSTLGEYGAAAVGGATAGETALYAVPTLGPVGIVAAGAAGSVVTDTLKAAATSKPLDSKEVAVNAAIAGATSLLPGAKAAVGSLAKQILTKAERGQIKSVTAKTAAMATAGKAATDASGAAIGAEAAGVKDRLTAPPPPPPRCTRSGSSPCGH